jgi:hypothetical protein
MNEDLLATLDSEVGDGDLGFNSKRAAESILEILDYLDFD